MREKRMEGKRWYWYGWASDPVWSVSNLAKQGKEARLTRAKCQGEDGWDIWYRPAVRAAAHA